METLINTKFPELDKYSMLDFYDTSIYEPLVTLMLKVQEDSDVPSPDKYSQLSIDLYNHFVNIDSSNYGGISLFNYYNNEKKVFNYHNDEKKELLLPELRQLASDIRHDFYILDVLKNYKDDAYNNINNQLKKVGAELTDNNVLVFHVENPITGKNCLINELSKTNRIKYYTRILSINNSSYNNSF